jgi:two-component system OmpR family sensor kinase
MTSLKKQLIVGALGLFTVVGLLASGISYFLAREDAGVLLDHQLLLVAGSVHEGSQLPAMQGKFYEQSPEEQKTGFVFQVWNEGIPVRVSRPDFDLPMGKATGYSDMSMQGEKWRAYTIVYPDRTVQVSQSDEVRREIATNAALRALLPIAILFPLSWLFIVFGVGHILKPLAEVAKAATERDASSLAPLPTEHIPQEIEPLIAEMNGLILRMGETIESQRHFMLDAAHELRTPLAALQLQIENLSRNSSKEDLECRVGELKSGIQRASHLVGQLLQMARFGAENPVVRVETDLGSVVKSCIGEFISTAGKRRIDLGMIHDDTALILANVDDLRILLNNLLDNAIRYTPEGGQVDVSVVVSGQKAVVEIADNGPGIPDALLQRVFDRFFRIAGHETEGSGIGLAIVNAIAIRESAEIKLSNRADNKGLIARATFNLYISPASKAISTSK